MKKYIILSIVIGLLFATAISYAQIGGGLSAPNYWKKVGNEVQLVIDSWDLKIGSITIGGSTTSDLDMGDDLILNIGNADTDFESGGGMSMKGRIFVTGRQDEAQLTVKGNTAQTSDLIVFEQSGGTDIFNLTNAGALDLLGGLEVGSNILSDTEDTDNLGSVTKEFANLYLGTGKIYFYTDQGETIYSDGTDLNITAGTNINMGATDFANNAVINLGDAGNDFGATNILVATTITGNLTANDAAGPAFVDEAATSTNPTICPDKAELDTGIGWASDTIHIVLGAADEYNFSTSALALGANNLTMSGSIGVTGTRVTKGWFDDLEVTNDIVGSITGNATTLTITDNENTNETNAIIFTSGGALTGGDLGLESDGDLYYNPSTGTLSATTFSGVVSGYLADSGDTATGDYDFTGAIFLGATPLVLEGTTDDAFQLNIAVADITTPSKTATFRDASGTILLSGDTLTGEVTATFDTDGTTAANIADSVTVTGWEMGASTATTPVADDNDTSLATSAYVQTEINALGGAGLTCTAGSCSVDLGTAIDASEITDNTIDFADIKQNNTLAGNPALVVDECYFISTTTGGGFICEGSTADTQEQIYKFPDVNGADTTNWIAVNSNYVANLEGNALSVTTGTLNVTEADPTVDTAGEILAIIDNTALDFGTGVLTATGFVGDVTGDCSGSSGSCTGNAATVTNATLTTALTVNTAAVTLAGGAGGSTLTLGTGASSVSGSNTGDQTSVAGNAGTVTVDATTSDTTCFLGVFESASGSLEPQTDATLIYDANTGQLGTTRLNLGVVASALGVLTLSGNTSGIVTINTAATAGTYSLTLPTTDGGASEFLQTNGSGVLSWAAGGAGDLKADGSVPLTSDWDIGAFTITGTQFISDIADGTAPFVVTSSTEVANLKAATVGTITGLAPDTATTQATQASITTCSALTTTGALASGSIASGFGTINIGTSNAVSCGSVELGHATDTTVARSAAGVLAVEGVVLPSISSTNTLTNKRITPRVTTEASSATPTINTDNSDAHSITALAANVTSFTTNLSGTPTNFQKLIIRILDNGTARTISWGASFEDNGVALPTTTTISKLLTVGFIYDTASSKWGCVAVADET